MGSVARAAKLHPPIWAAVVLGLGGLLQRLAVWSVYDPVSYGDTGSYFRLAAALARGTLDGYDGTRTPGYPAFVALLRLDPHAIWIAQMALGWCIPLLLFWMTYRVTANVWLGLGVGGLYDLLPGQFLFESNLLTETLTAFGIISSLALLVAVDKWKYLAPRVAACLAMGVAVSLAALTRPLFYFLPGSLLPFVAAAGGSRLSNRVTMSLAFALVPVISMGGWLGYIHSTYGMLSPTTMGGFSLVQHTGAFFEYVPEEEALLRDTYLKYRDARLADRGTQANTIWDAIPEMMQVSGQSFFDLSRTLGRLSFQLIREHPLLYLRSATIGWVDFWKAPVYWSPEAVKSQAARSIMRAWAGVGRFLCLGANILFLLSSAAMVVSRALRRQWALDIHVLAATSTVWIASILQTLLDHGDNPRFLVPVQMLVFYMLARVAYAWWRERRATEGQAA